MNNIQRLMHTVGTVAGHAVPGLAARAARNALLRPRRGVSPVTAAEREAELRGRRITFRFGLSGMRWGESGPVVLMLHGWEGRPTQFHAFIDPILASGRQIIALDAPAHGGSSGLETTLMEYAASVQEAAVEIRELESVVGHSMGGSVAAIALSRGLAADRAVLISSPSGIEQGLRAMAGAWGLPRSATRRFVRLVEAANGVLARELEISGIASRLKVPALVVHDEGDRAVSFRDGVEVAQAWPGARLYLTHGLGHSRILRDAGVVNEVTSFLANDEVRKPTRDSPNPLGSALESAREQRAPGVGAPAG